MGLYAAWQCRMVFFSTDSVSLRPGAAGHCAPQRQRLGLFARFCITRLLHTGRRWTYDRMSSDRSPEQCIYANTNLHACHVVICESSSFHFFSCMPLASCWEAAHVQFFRRSKDMEMLAWTLSAVRLRLSHGCVESRVNMVWCGSHDIVLYPRDSKGAAEHTGTGIN